jgi:HEAT repeat protein
VARLRPVALLLIEGEGDPPRLDQSDARILAEILARYARTLQGDSRERVTRFFESNGHVQEEVQHLRTGRVWRRAAAAYALGDMGSTQCSDGLIAALADPSRDVRWAATRSLGRLRVVGAVEPIVSSLAAGRLPHAIAGQALLDIGPAALPHLRELLFESTGTDSASARTRALAVELIGLLGSAADGHLLEERLRDPSAEVREQAARGLGRLGAREAAEALRAALADRIPAVRAAAAESLGVIRDRMAAAALMRQAEEDEFEPADAAARALCTIDPAAARAEAEEEASGPHLREAADLLQAFR